MTVGVVSEAGQVDSEVTVPRTETEISPADGELFYVERVEVERTQSGGSDSLRLAVERRDANGRVLANVEVSEGVGLKLESLSGFYLYPGENLKVQTEFAGNNPSDVIEYRLVARRIL